MDIEQISRGSIRWGERPREPRELLGPLRPGGPRAPPTLYLSFYQKIKSAKRRSGFRQKAGQLNFKECGGLPTRRYDPAGVFRHPEIINREIHIYLPERGAK